MAGTTQGTALITGASAGIGAIYADRLARRGYDLLLVARSQQRLDEVTAKIVSETGRKVETLVADLTTSDGRLIVEEVLRSREDISMLVNNAGFGGVDPLLSSNIDTMEEMIGVNVTALMRLTYAAVPAMVARGRGAIINISSIVAIGPEILNGVYGGSKAFVLAFTQSLLHELTDKGLRIQAVLPGGTATDFWSVAGFGEYAESPKAMPATAMVDAALAGFDAGETVTIPPLHEGELWGQYDALRRTISARLANTEPAPRYLHPAA